VFSSSTLNFIFELCRRICVHIGDARETSYLCRTCRRRRGRRLLLRSGLQLRATGGGATIPTPTLVVDCCPLLGALISDGPTRPLGYPRAETPLEENPQALPHRVRPGREAFPLDRDGWGGHGLSRLSRHRLGSSYGRNIRSYSYTSQGRSRSNRGDITRLYIAILARPLCFRPGVVESHRQQRKVKFKCNTPLYYTKQKWR